MATVNGAPASDQDDPHTISAEVPCAPLVSIEHPLIVNNLERGFESLGAEQQVKHILEDEIQPESNIRDGRSGRRTAGPVIGVSLRPENPLAKKLQSTPVDVRSVLVKVTVPKWTGRKRKRGSDGPFVESPTSSNGLKVAAPDLRRRLQDNIDRYEVEPVGMARTTHRFLDKPDLQTQNYEAPGLREIREHALIPSYNILGKFHVDLTPGFKGITALPRPPSFIPLDLQPDDPYDLGTAEVTGAQIQKSKVGPEPRTDDDVDHAQTTHKPPKPKPKPKPKSKPMAARHNEMDDNTRPAVEAYCRLLETRPMVTSSAMQGLLPEVPSYKFYLGKKFMPAQMTSGGPWHGCYIKDGIDPASDVEYRFYQTVQTYIQKAGAKALKREKMPYVFDGVTPPRRGRKWQLCDITDPLLQSLVNTSQIREECDLQRCGWYLNGTASKIRAITRDKMKRLATGQSLLSQAEYEAIADLPDLMDEQTDCEIRSDCIGSEAQALAALIKKDALGYFGGKGVAGDGDGDGVGSPEAVEADEEEDEEETYSPAVDPDLEREDVETQFSGAREEEGNQGEVDIGGQPNGARQTIGDADGVDAAVERTWSGCRAVQ